MIMKKIVWVWNLIHYYIYRWFECFDSLCLKILPFRSKKIKNSIIESQSGEKGGFNITSSGRIMMLLLFLIFVTIILFYSNFIDSSLAKFFFSGGKEKYSILGILGLVFTINYYALYKGDKYLAYFKEFKGFSKTQKVKFGFLSLSIVLITLLLFITSLSLF